MENKINPGDAVETKSRKENMNSELDGRCIIEPVMTVVSVIGESDNAIVKCNYFNPANHRYEEYDFFKNQLVKSV